MGREIELKIPLSKEEFVNIFKAICGSGADRKKSNLPFHSSKAPSSSISVSLDNKGMSFSSPELLFKSDEYFSQYKSHQERLENEPRVIRIRTEIAGKLLDSAAGNLADNLAGNPADKLTDIPAENPENKPAGQPAENLADNSAENLTDNPAHKIPLNVEKYEDLVRFIQTKKEESLQNANTAAFFTIKSKKIENGMEFNEEKETSIDDPEILRAFFAGTHFDCWFKKEKIAFSSHYKVKSATGQPMDFHLELEIVNGLPYLEIENTQENFAPEEIRSQLENLVRRLSLDPSKKDSRSWVQIINGE
ncbi:MAG: hypothetical protein K6E78_05940 [Treponema sp.]|nr:hypothetical protein [Treponema sp.]